MNTGSGEAAFYRCPDPGRSGLVHVQITSSPMDGNEPRETGGAAGIPTVSYDYRITVRDQSSRHGFRLSGNGLTRRSGLAYKGTRTWSVPLEQGSYTFSSEGPGGTRKTFAVLVAG